MGKELMDMKNDGGIGKGFSHLADAERQEVDTALEAECTPERVGLIPRN